MKRVAILFVFLLLAAAACNFVDFNPGPLATTSPAEGTTRTPTILMATPTLTAVPPTLTALPPTETQVLPTPSETTPPLPTATPVLPSLSVDQLRNATFTLATNDRPLRTFTLKDGEYISGTDTSQPDYVRIHMGSKIAFGDLNADGLEDAAIILVENYGGSGEFLSVVSVLNQNGETGPAASAFIDDRPMINELAIQNGEIFVDAVIHSQNDPMCCPAMPSRQLFRLMDNTLLRTRLSTFTPDGLERRIQVDSPSDGSEISGPFIIKGSVSVSPFENTLAYSIYVDGEKDPREKNSFTISADGLGGPGTFELPLSLNDPAIQGPVRIVISDISPANGSAQALSTVFLVIK